MKKGKSSLLVQGMGLGMQLLMELSTKLTERTGSDEALHFLVKKRFKGNLDAVVDAIVACDWRIPASEIRDRAQKSYMEMFEHLKPLSAEETDALKNLEWSTPLYELGITFRSFDDNPAGSGNPAIPPHYRGLLDGMTVTYPIRVTEGKPSYDYYQEYIVFDLEMLDGNHRPLPGETLVGSNIKAFSLVEARYIDFDR